MVEDWVSSGSSKEVMDERRLEDERRRELEDREAESKENEVGSEAWEAQLIRKASQMNEVNSSKLKYKLEKLRLEGEVKASHRELNLHLLKQAYKQYDIRGYKRELQKLVQKKNKAEYDYALHTRSNVIV